MKQTDQRTQEGSGRNRGGEEMGRDKGDVDGVRGQERPVNISFVCRRYEGKGVAQMWAAARVQGQHESVHHIYIIYIIGGALETSHTFSSEQKSRLISIYLHRLAATGQRWRTEEKDVFSCSCCSGENPAAGLFQGVALTDGQADTSTR